MKTLSLSVKVMGPLILLVLSGAAVGIIGINKMDSQNHSLVEFAETVTPRMLLAKNSDLALARMAISVLYMVNTDKKEDVETNWKKINVQHGLIQNYETQYLALATPDGISNYKAFVQNVNLYLHASEQAYRLLLAGKKAETVQAVTLMREKRGESQKLIDDIVQRDDQALMNAVKSQTISYRNSRLQMFWIGVIAISLSAVVGLMMVRGVAQALLEVIRKLRKTSDDLGTASNSISTSSDALSQATTEQAASLEETASAIDEMTSVIQKNSENAENASKSAVTSETSTRKGREAVNRMLHSIQEIDQSNQHIGTHIEESNKQLSEIIRVINGIGTKTRVINDIVFQTKLLSFNASVEAARAGEAGKGFAVVAEEVGKLAQMSGASAKEISDMLDSSVKKVNQIITDTQQRVQVLLSEGREKVNGGTQIAKECDQALDEIVSHISVVTQMSQSIAVGSQEQARGAQEVASAMGQLNQVTQSN